jgi:biotin carboxyl carrier protein
MNFSFWYQNNEYKISVREKSENFLHVSLGRKEYDVSVELITREEFLIKINGQVYDVMVSSNASSYDVRVNGKCIKIGKKSAPQLLGEKSSQFRKREVKTSMPGRIIKILAEEEGDVEEGQAVLILEAMKMQNEIKSPQKGKISRIGPKVGDSVKTGALLFVVE